ncbi:hypothetical protein [Owenweeksia hongkongensis]|uniref:hypothetical protein n=1 Tax=Owenweeksia hongkongensis TaxID=253245 RepID=UPI003A90B430
MTQELLSELAANKVELRSSKKKGARNHYLTVVCEVKRSKSSLNALDFLFRFASWQNEK